MSVLDADLACMKALWELPPKDPASKSPPWKYLINLTGQEFPLKNNLELTRILRVLNNANLIEQVPWVNFLSFLSYKDLIEVGLQGLYQP